MVSRLDCRFVEPNGECAIHSKTTDPMEERAYAALCSVGQAELEVQLRGDIESLGQEVIHRASRLAEAEGREASLCDFLDTWAREYGSKRRRDEQSE